ncbi:MAG TPA: M20/M25/M40 family metallo-hydrolase, partial [Chloroflexota bacterium]|nr:M20/M25/M40 family metallo-hydrolase [Chloroflexota bacterium]
MFDRIREAAARRIDSTVEFASRLVQTPSMPGHEGDVAALVQAEMTRLGYDRVEVDDVGNVMGLLRGQRSGRSVMFNTHMDHVSPGDRAFWRADPYSGQVADGSLWGRGSTDIKGPMACQIHTVPLLKEAGLLPAGDVWVVAVVMEEVGGLGTQQLVHHLRTDSAVVGEPSQCQLKRGHRGRTGLEARIVGKAGHASAPDRAVNPHYVAAALLLALRDLPMVTHPDFGAATLVPTIYRS